MPAFPHIAPAESALPLVEADIGGARVRRTFTRAGETLKGGQYLTRADILAMPASNRRALMSGNYIEVFPRSPVTSAGDVHIVHIGRGQYDVFKGDKLNDRPLTKEEAEELATTP